MNFAKQEFDKGSTLLETGSQAGNCPRISPPCPLLQTEITDCHPKPYPSPSRVQILPGSIEEWLVGNGHPLLLVGGVPWLPGGLCCCVQVHQVVAFGDVNLQEDIKKHRWALFPVVFGCLCSLKAMKRGLNSQQDTGNII